MDRVEDEETENDAEVNNHSSVHCKSKLNISCSAKMFMFVSKHMGVRLIDMLWTLEPYM